ncbi:hypothetical protein H4R33_003346 [Dimargaris cristalligena]|nr:hypothetical protein H4R33_003346 [Dimargaris cristalligena]
MRALLLPITLWVLVLTRDTLGHPADRERFPEQLHDVETQVAAASRPYIARYSTASKEKRKEIQTGFVFKDLMALPQELFNIIVDQLSLGSLWQLSNAFENMPEKFMSNRRMQLLIETKVWPCLESGTADFAAFKKLLPVQVNSALLVRAWEFLYGTAYKELRLMRIGGKLMRAHLKSASIPGIFQAIHADWGYLHYGELSASQRSVAFPLVELLSAEPMDDLLQAYLQYKLNAQRASSGPLTIAIDSNAPEKVSNQASVTFDWHFGEYPIYEETLMGIGAVLAFNGEYRKLLGLLEAMDRGCSSTSPTLPRYLALLVLEFGGIEFHARALHLATKASPMKAMAQQLGMAKAAALLPEGQPAWDTLQTLKQATARKFIHMDYDAQGKLRLAIRVCRSTVVNLLPDLDTQESAWLPTSEVEAILDSVSMSIPDWLPEYTQYMAN